MNTCNHKNDAMFSACNCCCLTTAHLHVFSSYNICLHVLPSTGIVGGSHSIQTVGGSNHLCLPEDPTLTGNTLGSARTTVSGAEFGGLPNHYVPCAVCQATRRSVLMIPARNQCHPGWTTEYTGYLSAELDGHQRTEFVCMDDKPEHIAHRSSSHGLFLYPAVTSCGPLPCPPYVENAELLCAVCTR